MPSAAPCTQITSPSNKGKVNTPRASHIGDAERGPGDAERGLGDAERGFGDAERGLRNEEHGGNGE
eukprot:CAMPEP_0169122430 /NCGR_PEP_ID=MMETSP1015-20121227/33221_1 /TAXON_ID=342587 /ORGANISM="Karlodinium micrum, Strain CCMP2283" /LENGTH=65 /DNA_ID=CAMNT_0009185647 /DNA_START=1015 /DNA_END=1212 /DNA_ORIENTATION=-